MLSCPLSFNLLFRCVLMCFAIYAFSASPILSLKVAAFYYEQRRTKFQMLSLVQACLHSQKTY